MTDQSDGHFSAEQIDDLWANLEINSEEKALVIASPRPESIFAASLICRAYLANHTPFTLTYAEPVSNIDRITELSQAQGAPLTVVIGTAVHGPVGDFPSRLIFLGCDLPSEILNQSLGSVDSLAPSSCAFAEKIVSLNRWHKQLAAATVLAQKWRDLTPSTASNEIVQMAFEEDYLEQRRGLKLFGINHLSAKDALLYSIYPYLQGLSGVEDACDTLIKEANIPLSKRALPMMALSNDEKKRISQILIRESSNTTIEDMLGEDYIFLYENEETPFRFMSSILPLLKTCWKMLTPGIAASVCIGDRSRLLHSLIKSYIEHCKNTTSGFHTLTKRADEGKLDTIDDFVIIPDLGVEPSVLPDIGRIAFDTRLFEPNRFLLLDSDQYTELVWNEETHGLEEILPTLEKEELRISTTSSYSIRLFDIKDFSKLVKLIQNEIGDTS